MHFYLLIYYITPFIIRVLNTFVTVHVYVVMAGRMSNTVKNWLIVLVLKIFLYALVLQTGPLSPPQHDLITLT